MGLFVRRLQVTVFDLALDSRTITQWPPPLCWFSWCPPARWPRLWPSMAMEASAATTATAWAEDSVCHTATVVCGECQATAMDWATATDSASEWALPQLSGSACPSWAVLAKRPTKSSHPSTELARTSSCSGLTAAHDICLYLLTSRHGRAGC